MMAPRAHVGSLVDLDDDETLGVSLVRRSLTVLGDVMAPNGFNTGVNLGRVAGAGTRPRPFPRGAALGRGYQLHAGPPRGQGDRRAPRPHVGEGRAGVRGAPVGRRLGLRPDAAASAGPGGRASRYWPPPPPPPVTVIVAPAIAPSQDSWIG